MKHQTQITLYNSYFDINNNLSTKAILNIFQDVASIHAEELGVGYQAMLEKNLYWVLSRIKFDILKMPDINQTVIVETWPHIKGRIDFDRDFKISNLNGDVLIIGTSKWCVIDTTTRMLQRTDNVNYISNNDTNTNMEFVLEKNYEGKFGKVTLPELDHKHVFDYTVLYSDLDHNQHMNNTNYANLILSAVENKNYSHFEINFLNECKLNDIINVSTIKHGESEYIIGTIDERISFNAIIK